MDKATAGAGGGGSITSPPPITAIMDSIIAVRTLSSFVLAVCRMASYFLSCRMKLLKNKFTV